MAEENVPKFMTNPDNIGKVVTIQIFHRTNISDVLDLGTMQKYIGTLEGVWFDKKSLNFKLQGIPTVTMSRRKHFVEFYLKD